MKDSKMVWAWVGGAIVVIAVVAGAVWHFYAKQAVTGPVAVHAPAGQLISGFPVALILDGAQVSNSYSINYSTSTNQYTAEYYSSSTVTTLYKDYQSYLPKNNWIETNVATATSMFGAIAASQGDNRLQVVISAQHGESQVTITYVVVSNNVASSNSPGAVAAAPSWINVTNGQVPPDMVPGVPIPSHPAVSVDRYYIEGTTTHGEYAYDFGGGYAQSVVAGDFKTILTRQKWNITSASESGIMATAGPYSVNIVFTSQNAQSTIVDINYIYEPSSK